MAANPQLSKAWIGTTRAAQERAQMFPFSDGQHTPRELAEFLAEGMSIDDVAKRWGLRPKAGGQDLRYDIELCWIRRGCPGGMAEPTGHGPAFEAEWAVWHEELKGAVLRWLATLVGEPDRAPAHCGTCRCFEPAGAPDGE